MTFGIRTANCPPEGGEVRLFFQADADEAGGGVCRRVRDGPAVADGLDGGHAAAGAAHEALGAQQAVRGVGEDAGERFRFGSGGRIERGLA